MVAGAVVVAGVVVAVALGAVVGGPVAVGFDFLPLRHAAEALLRGESVFTDPFFVYPPTAAVVLLPAALGTPTAALVGWYLAGMAALLLAAWMVARCAPRPYRMPVFALAVVGLLGGTVAQRSLALGNLSVLLVPVAVGVLLAFHRGRWVLGCALLAGSLLVKPLLAPLVLVPLLHRRWAALARAVLPAGALLLASLALVPGGERFPAVLRYCLTGTNLHGDLAVHNLSLRGWVEAQQAPPLLGVAASVAVVVAVTAAVVHEGRNGSWLTRGRHIQEWLRSRRGETVRPGRGRPEPVPLRREGRDTRWSGREGRARGWLGREGWARGWLGGEGRARGWWRREGRARERLWRGRARPVPLGRNGRDPVWLGTVLLLGTFLAGGISEVHFLLVTYGMVLLLAGLGWGVAPFLPGLVLLAYPSSGQHWLVGGEVLLLVALLKNVRASGNLSASGGHLEACRSTDTRSASGSPGGVPPGVAGAAFSPPAWRGWLRWPAWDSSAGCHSRPPPTTSPSTPARG